MHNLKKFLSNMHIYMHNLKKNYIILISDFGARAKRDCGFQPQLTNLTCERSEPSSGGTS